MAYKAGEGTAQRFSNTNSHSKQCLPLTTTSMSTMLPWNPFLVCEIEVSPNDGPGSCCGMTKRGAPCKNSIKFEDTKIGHQNQINTFYGRKTDILLVFNGVLCSTLMSTLIQLSDTIHHSYIAKGAGMRTLKRYYHIGRIPVDYNQRT